MGKYFEPPSKPQIGRWASSGIVVSMGGLVSIGPDDTLRCEFDPYRSKWKNPPDDLLDQFATLWQKRPKAIVAFASKWGPLRIDANGKQVDVVKPFSEPLSAWRYLSRRAYSVLRIWKELQAGQIGSDDDWDLLTTVHRREFTGTDDAFSELVSLSPHEGGQNRLGLPEQSRWEFSAFSQKYSGYSDPIAYAKAVIAGEVSAWLKQFGVGVSVRWDPATSWRIEMNYGGLMLSAVALQMAFTIAHGDRFFTCSGCGSPYNRPPEKRRPNAGQGNFCGECAAKRKPQAKAERVYREKRREARRLADEGMPVVEIANTLDRTADVVRGWLKRSTENGKKKTRKR